MRDYDGPSLYVDKQLYRSSQLQTILATLWLRRSSIILYSISDLVPGRRAVLCSKQIFDVLYFCQVLGLADRERDDGLLGLEHVRSINGHDVFGVQKRNGADI